MEKRGAPTLLPSPNLNPMMSVFWGKEQVKKFQLEGMDSGGGELQGTDNCFSQHSELLAGKQKGWFGKLPKQMASFLWYVLLLPLQISTSNTLNILKMVIIGVTTNWSW